MGEQVGDDTLLWSMKQGADEVFVAINRGEAAGTVSGLPGG